MKSIAKAVLCYQMTSLLLTMTFVRTAAAEKQVPFKGSVQAVESYDIQFPTMLVDTIGSGNATQLGEFIVTWEFTVDLVTGAGIGSAHFIAANGDSLFTVSLGQGDPTETPGVNRVVEMHTIKGGTGRFAGATGSFTLERLAALDGITSGSFQGTIAESKAK